MKIKQTGVIELIDDLANKDVWMYMVNGIFSLKEGKACFPLDTEQKGKFSVIIHKVVPRGKVPISVMYQTGMKNLLYPERGQQQQILHDGLQQIFQSLVNDSWLLLGVVVRSSGADIPFAILYFESFEQGWYSLLNLEQKKVLEQYVQQLN